MKGNPYLDGKLLLAMPAIGDPRFDHAVIALISHDAAGAMGIAVGEEADLTVNELAAQMGIAVAPAMVAMLDRAVLVGGPVDQQRGFVIHSLDWVDDSSLDVDGQFGITASQAIIEAIATGSGPQQWQVAMGYAGWGPGQLEGEFTDNVWYATHCDDDVLHQIAPERRWAAVLARDGINPGWMAGQGGNA